MAERTRRPGRYAPMTSRMTGPRCAWPTLGLYGCVVTRLTLHVTGVGVSVADEERGRAAPQGALHLHRSAVPP
jgi:hypothetical protein